MRNPSQKFPCQEMVEEDQKYSNQRPDPRPSWLLLSINMLTVALVTANVRIRLTSYLESALNVKAHRLGRAQLSYPRLL